MIPILSKFKPTIIIEDASHVWSHQIASFEICFPYISKGGIYICEDLQTSFGRYREKQYNDQQLDAATYFSNLDLLTVNCGVHESHPLLNCTSKVQSDIAKEIYHITLRKHCVLIKKC